MNPRRLTILYVTITLLVVWLVLTSAYFDQSKDGNLISKIGFSAIVLFTAIANTLISQRHTGKSTATRRRSQSGGTRRRSIHAPGGAE